MSPKVTEAYREATRTEIIRAAAKVFARKGYHGASMDDIVAESRLSKGALYGYFDSKEDLFLAVHDSVLDFDLGRLLETFPPTATATEKLVTAGELALRSIARRDRDILRVSYEFWTSAPRIKKLQRYYTEADHRNHRFLVDLLREGMSRGEFRGDLDPQSLAWSLIAVVDGLGLHSAAVDLGGEYDWPAIEQSFLSVVKNGILATPGRASRTK